MARLTGADGTPCGIVEVNFRSVIGANGVTVKYEVDNGDLGGVLRLIDTCASAIGGEH